MTDAEQNIRDEGRREDVYTVLQAFHRMRKESRQKRQNAPECLEEIAKVVSERMSYILSADEGPKFRFIIRIDGRSDASDYSFEIDEDHAEMTLRRVHVALLRMRPADQVIAVNYLAAQAYVLAVEDSAQGDVVWDVPNGADPVVELTIDACLSEGFTPSQMWN